MRRSGRSVNRKDRDRGVEMRLTERTGKLIPEASDVFVLDVWSTESECKRTTESFKICF